MKITDIDIIAQLERLAEAYPWDTVNLWVCRTPAGQYSFTRYVSENTKFGFLSIFSCGSTPEEAVEDAIKQTAARDPEIARAKKIAELRDTIAKLQAVVIGLPPYRPNRELTNGEHTIKSQVTVDV